MQIIAEADGRNLNTSTGGQPVTSGSVGIDAVFSLSSDYDGLAVFAVFRCGEKSIDVALDDSLRCVVPWEVLQVAGYPLYMGVVGKDGNGDIVIPTVWAHAACIEQGAVVSGIDPSDPTPDIAAQILQLAQQTAARAETAESEAEAARDAIINMGVEAHEDPQGASVTKHVDPVTGTITLDFGIPSPPVTSVNNKTGAVMLNLDNIPNGETYARATPEQLEKIVEITDAQIDALFE